MGQHLVAIFELDPEHRVREWLGDGSFQNYRVFLGLWQGSILLRMCRSSAQNQQHTTGIVAKGRPTKECNGAAGREQMLVV